MTIITYVIFTLFVNAEDSSCLLSGNSCTSVAITSSTEVEVVGVHDNMPSILFTRYFLEAQGYPLKTSIVHQDNQSSILLETNGRGSSSKRMRHMNIRYFFIADCAKRGHVEIRYCPTDEMIGDFFTKPLGGAKFRRFRNIIMNCSEDEHGAVDVDELMARHYKTVDKGGQEQNAEFPGNEPTFLRKDIISKDVRSQECVGDLAGSAHQINGNGGRAPGQFFTQPTKDRRTPRTWAQVVAVAE